MRDTLAASLADLGDASAPALSDGLTWLTRGQLMTGAVTAGEPALLPGEDPVAAVHALVAAQRAGAVPVLAALAGAQVVDDARTRLAGVEEPLLVVQTSGTAGTPRAVVRTARSWQISLAPFSRVTGVGPDDVVWAPGVPTSTLTFFALWHALATGARAVASGRWRGVGLLGPHAGQASVVQCVPAVLSAVLAARADGGLPGLRRAVVAGGPLPPAVLRRAEELEIEVVTYYGAAELSFVAVSAAGMAALRPFPGVEVDARDGLLWARSPYLSYGYLVPDPSGPWRLDGDGWACVGDRGEVLTGGEVVVRGRDEDAVSVGGHVVLVGDVEAALGDVPGVLEVVCLPVPHAGLGQQVVVVVRGRRDVLPALRAAATARLAPPARPGRYVVLEDFPRTPGGKVARAALAQQVARRLRA